MSAITDMSFNAWMEVAVRLLSVGSSERSSSTKGPSKSLNSYSNKANCGRLVSKTSSLVLFVTTGTSVHRSKKIENFVAKCQIVKRYVWFYLTADLVMSSMCSSGQVSCRLCKERSHIPLSCQEYRKENGMSERRVIEEARTEALIRTCHKCKLRIMKIDGCNKVVCTGCYSGKAFAQSPEITR